MKMKLGRKPRAFNPAVKTLKALAPHVALAVPPPAANWTKGIQNFGMMLNDQLGDCTCAAIGHARQIWTANASVENTMPDADVLKLYEAACGYVPGDSSTDQGGVEQNVLSYCVRNGVPLPQGVDKFLGFVEVDHTNLNEVKLTIQEFGCAYIGIQVPESIYDAEGNVQKEWGYVLNSPIEGGHAIILVGYDETSFTFISWGQLYKMTNPFFQRYCDEVYAIVSQDWINSQGKTPLGITLEQLEAISKEL